jgi:hypothetical protein
MFDGVFVTRKCFKASGQIGIPIWPLAFWGDSST